MQRMEHTYTLTSTHTYEGRLVFNSDCNTIWASILGTSGTSALCRVYAEILCQRVLGSVVHLPSEDVAK
jgi:hypothetical protein